MTDLRLPLSGVNFSVRAAIFCVRGGRVLATSEPGLPLWYLPGGALRVDEETAAGARREWREETGLAPGPLRLLGVVETFFQAGQTRHHEIGFFFRMEAPPELPTVGFPLLDPPDFFYDWIPLDELASRPVHPLAAHALLNSPGGTARHIVNRENRAQAPVLHQMSDASPPAPRDTPRVTDIRLPLGGLKFSVRVAILCVREGRLLANTTPGLGFWFLPGGALSTDEDTVTCAAREWLEETGTPPGPLRLVGVLENFFGPPEKRQHEVGFYFRMEAPPELPEGEFTVLDNADYFYGWVPLHEIAARPVYPLAVAEFLSAAPGKVRHLVERS